MVARSLRSRRGELVAAASDRKNCSYKGKGVAAATDPLVAVVRQILAAALGRDAREFLLKLERKHPEIGPAKAEHFHHPARSARRLPFDRRPAQARAVVEGGADRPRVDALGRRAGDLDRPDGFAPRLADRLELGRWEARFEELTHRCTARVELMSQGHGRSLVRDRRLRYPSLKIGLGSVRA
jgi:hypothetical protein